MSIYETATLDFDSNDNFDSIFNRITSGFSDEPLPNRMVTVYDNKILVGTRYNVRLFDLSMNLLNSATNPTSTEDTTHRFSLFDDYSRYGNCVCMNNNYIIIGEPGFEARIGPKSGIQNEGCIYVYDTDLNYIHTIITSTNDGEPTGRGWSLAISNTLILTGGVSIPYNGGNYGLSKVEIPIDDNSWSSTYFEDYTNYSQRQNFLGFSVSLSGSNAVVSEHGINTIYVTNSLTTSNQYDNVKETKTGEPNSTEYGYSTSIDGNTLVVGAPGNASIHVYTMIPDASSNILSQAVNLFDTESTNRLGHSVCVHNNLIVAGAPYATVNGQTNAGKIYVYSYNYDDFSLEEVAVMEGSAQNEYYGSSVSIYNYNIAVYSASKVYLYTMTPEIIGDPYIKPIYGNLYKLPDVDACYRILESKSIKINAQVQKVDQEYINNYTREINNIYFVGVNETIYDWQDMYFFTKMCIHYNEEIAIFDMLKCELVGECPLWLTVKSEERQKITSELYNQEFALCVVTLSVNNIISIQSALYLNPQVLTGLKVKESHESLDGLLMYKYKSESAQVTDLYDACKCVFKKAKIDKFVNETFYTNDGYTKMKKICVV